MSDDALMRRLLSGRYQVERLLGRGGMASVYLAHDRRQDRRVAVKVLDPELASSITGERFLREIGLASRLAHPNVLPLHDSGEDAGLLYYVMPYVEGETLRARLDRERQLPVREALRIACEVAHALDYAHRQGILHRDVKPENILLADGHAMLADFGIARAIGSAADDRLTATGMALGTPAYMSPEQSTGERTLDARSDVYSLACVLYEALAGEPPFTGVNTQSVIAKRLGGSPPRIRTVRPSVPEAVELALLHAMDRTPADRFGSAREFADALAACETGSSAASPVRPRRARRAWTGAAVLLAVSIAATGWWARTRAVEPSAVPTVAVLPLTNQSPDPDYAYLADGLTDAVIGDLTRTPGIRVVSRGSVTRFGGGMASMSQPAGAMPPPATRMSPSAAATASAPARTVSMGSATMGAPRATAGADEPMRSGAVAMPMGARPPLAEMARQLHADLVFDGTLSRSGDSVRVVASLVRAASREALWRGSYTHHVHDLLGLQRDLVATIVRTIGGGSTDAAVLSSRPRSYLPAAHEAYLKGEYFQAHWKLPQAVAEFERAVELDSTHAPAQAGLSRAYYFLSFFGQLPPSVAAAGMRRAATAALAQDSLLADAHAQMALVKMLQEWDWPGAEREFRRALELSPDDAQIRHDYAHFLLAQGRQRESAEQTRRALALDPANPMLISCLGWHDLFDGQYADAERNAREANAMMPDQWAYVVLGWSLLGQGKRDSAVSAFRAARRVGQTTFTLAALGYALAAAGRSTEARAVLDSLLAKGEGEYVSPYDVATVYAGLGDRDAAFHWLRRAADERTTFVVHVGWDARFDRIRSDPRFAELAERQLRLPTPRFATLTAEERRGM